MCGHINFSEGLTWYREMSLELSDVLAHFSSSVRRAPGVSPNETATDWIFSRASCAALR